MTLEALCAPRNDVLVYDTFNAAAACAAAAGSFVFGNAPAVEPMTALAAQAPGGEGENRVQQQMRRKRRRRQRSVRNAEDAENQRMTHIAVERNRRRQMNEYLAVLRSLMPESYVHRSDQASVVSGAIDFVKELEQQLQSLEAQKLELQQQQQQQRGDTAAPVVERDVAPTPTRDPAPAAEDAAAREAAAAAERPPFTRFFRYPQYSWRHAPPRDDVAAAAVGAEEDASRASAVADVEVGMVVDAHASLRVMAPRRPGQLLKMVGGMQALGLAVLHLNVTAALGGELALYTLSLKVEEGSGLTTAEDIAAAAHHVLGIIDAEAAAAAQRLLAPAGAGQPAGTSSRQYEPGAAGGGYSSST